MVSSLVSLLLGLASSDAPSNEECRAEALRGLRTLPEFTAPFQSYALLVFGDREPTYRWLILDGDTLYVDLNANGDLTESGERQTSPSKDSTA